MPLATVWEDNPTIRPVHRRDDPGTTELIQPQSLPYLWTSSDMSPPKIA